jgi:hypothetical protein
MMLIFLDVHIMMVVPSRLSFRHRRRRPLVSWITATSTVYVELVLRNINIDATPFDRSVGRRNVVQRFIQLATQFLV